MYLTTTFQDVLKSSYLENIGSFHLLDAVLAMGISFIMGLFICCVYKKTFQGIMFSQSFGISLIAMTLITTFVILAITSNVVLSLGMVGALSIVRFRSAVKEPIDIAFLFWAIAVGIVTGAGMIPLAVFGSICIGFILIVFANKKTKDTPYILVMHCNNKEAEDHARKLIASSVNRQALKSKSISAGGIELTMEVRLKEEETEFINQLTAMAGVRDAVLVSYNGDYMS